MDYSLDKHELLRGFSYPLKWGDLDALLNTHEVSLIHAMYFWRRTEGNIVLRADYLSEAKKGWFAAGRSSITVYAVPSGDRLETERALHRAGLTRLGEWLRRAEHEGNVWRGSDHSLVFRYAESKLTVADS